MCEWVSVCCFGEGGVPWKAVFVDAVFVEFLEGFDDEGVVGFEHFDESDIC